MKSFSQLRQDSDRGKIGLLFTDLELALTFLDLADTTNIAENRERRRREARKAYETVKKRALTAELTPEQRTRLDRKLELIKTRL